jgi:SAM-dependent methyltransferase
VASFRCAQDRADFLSGLDHDFLHYIGRDIAGLQRIQRFYLPFFAGCRQVVDLGCGEGEFVALLLEQGIEATGVDSDAKVSAAAQARGLPVVQQDVFDYLAEAPAASVDGIFCAHLVEHLPYPQVIELAERAYRILRPGGRFVLATPDVRSLYTHLESFYLHFGHVSFYHPRLLCFFLERAGFAQAEYGVNPATASPLLSQAQVLAQQSPRQTEGPGPRLSYLREIPPQGRSPLRRLSSRVKNWLARWLVLPLTDNLDAAVDERLTLLHERLALLDRDLLELAQSLQSLNGPYECYATVLKPGPDGRPGGAARAPIGASAPGAHAVGPAAPETAT